MAEKKNKKTKVIVIISHSSQLAGGELSLLDLATSLKEMGYKCYVILPSKGPLESHLRKIKINYIIIPYEWWRIKKPNKFYKKIIKTFYNIYYITYSIPKITRYLKKVKADIIISNSSVILSGAISSNIIKKPHIWFIREYGYLDLDLSFILGEKISYWIINKLSSQVVVNSNILKNYYEKYIFRDKISVLFPKPIKFVRHYEKDKDDILYNDYLKCLLVGRLSEFKGQEDAILAIKELVVKEIKVKLLIVGDGSREYKKYLHELVAKNNLKEHITFYGWLDNPSELYEESNVFLMCSKQEAFGRVTLEAMIHKKPIIAARSGGNIELVIEGFNGFLYSPGNYKELSEKILKFYMNKYLIREYGLNGYIYALNKYNYYKYKNKLSDILRPYE